MSVRRTGSWVVRQSIAGRARDAYLIGGPFEPGSIRAWLSWGSEADAYVFPTKKAAVDAVRSAGRAFDSSMTVERSYGHEEGTR